MDAALSTAERGNCCQLWLFGMRGSTARLERAHDGIRQGTPVLGESPCLHRSPASGSIRASGPDPYGAPWQTRPYTPSRRDRLRSGSASTQRVHASHNVVALRGIYCALIYLRRGILLVLSSSSVPVPSSSSSSSAPSSSSLSSSSSRSSSSSPGMGSHAR